MVDKRRAITSSIAYPQEMHDQAFALWYKSGRKFTYKEIRKLLGQENERVPSASSLDFWKEIDHWEEHADELDAQVDNSMDKEIVAQRAEVIKRQADIGAEMIDMGMGYLRDKGIDTSADAIRAIAKGAELQEKQLGWAIVFTELAKASDDDLEKKLRKLMTDEVIIEGTVAQSDESEPEEKSDE